MSFPCKLVLQNEFQSVCDMTLFTEKSLILSHYSFQLQHFLRQRWLLGHQLHQEHITMLGFQQKHETWCSEL